MMKTYSYKIAQTKNNAILAAAGCQLIAACDLVVCSDRSSFSTPGYCVINFHEFVSILTFINTKGEFWHILLHSWNSSSSQHSKEEGSIHVIHWTSIVC